MAGRHSEFAKDRKRQRAGFELLRRRVAEKRSFKGTGRFIGFLKIGTGCLNRVWGWPSLDSPD